MLRIVFENMKIKCREDIRHTQGTCGVPAPCTDQHRDYGLTDFLRLFLQLRALGIGKRHRFSIPYCAGLDPEPTLEPLKLRNLGGGVLRAQDTRADNEV